MSAPTSPTARPALICSAIAWSPTFFTFITSANTMQPRMVPATLNVATVMSIASLPVTPVHGTVFVISTATSSVRHFSWVLHP